MERRALYNTLRLNWTSDPNLSVQPWQVENYRLLSLEELFSGLKALGVSIDRSQFSELSQEVDSPEEFTEMLLPETSHDQNPELGDQIYLYVFEIWRRIVPEKQSLSLLCDELDYQMGVYDAASSILSEGIDNVLGHLQMLLKEHEEEGGNSKQLFYSISAGCAHDLEGFLYDYIAAQIEHKNDLYAGELLEVFLPYVQEDKWFKLLLAQTLFIKEEKTHNEILKELVKGVQKKPDLEFQLEILSHLAHSSDEAAFLQLVKQTASQLVLEQDFWDLLVSVIDYFHFKDEEDKEHHLATLGQKRTEAFPPDALLSQTDSDLAEVLQMLNLKVKPRS